MEWIRNVLFVLPMIRTKEVAYIVLAIAIVTAIILVPVVRYIVFGIYAVSATVMVVFMVSVLCGKKDTPHPL